MAGLCAAARARELGAEPVVLEKGDRPGGSMLLSSGVVWRYRTLEEYRAQCPGGDPALQRLIVERLDDALDWLERLGAPVGARETGNPLTVGRRFEPRGLTEALTRPTTEIQLGRELDDLTEPPLILATGGFPVRFAREFGLISRSNPWSDGGGIDHAMGRGASLSGETDEFYGRAMPDCSFGEGDFVRLAQLYGRFAWVVNEHGERFFDGPVAWHENDLVQAIARQPHGAAWYLLNEEALEERVRERRVADMVDSARAAGAPVVEPRELAFPTPEDAVVAVRVRAAVTHTIRGLPIDTQAQVSPGLWAAGVDAGGWSTGGYASGLAAALVLGLTAAEAALS